MRCLPVVLKNSWLSNSLPSSIVPFLSGCLCGLLAFYITIDGKGKLTLSQDEFSNRYHRNRLIYDKLTTELPSEAVPLIESIENQQSNENTTLLCWVAVSPDAHARTRFLKNTWAKRCDKLLFMSTVSDPSVPTVKLQIANDTYNNLWGKTKASLKYIYDHHLQDAKWFFKADLDTYVIIENLKEMLSSYDPSAPMILGRRFQNSPGVSFYSGGAGYVLNREAIRRFVEHSSDIGCKMGDEGAEDLLLTSCMEKLGVTLGDSRDESGLHRFNSHNLSTALTYFSNTGQYFAPAADAYPNNGDRHSLTPISFHYVKDYEHMLYDFLLYNVTVHRDTSENL